MLLACVVVVLLIIIGGLGVYVILRLCRMLDHPAPPGGQTNDAMAVEMTLPETPGAASYRLVLQRSIDGTNWDDVMGASYGGHAGVVSGLTNWTQLGLFRIKAFPQ